MTKLQIEKRNLLVSPVICAFSIKGNVDFPRAHGEKKFLKKNNDHFYNYVGLGATQLLFKKILFIHNKFETNVCASALITTSVAMVLQLLSGMT